MKKIGIVVPYYGKFPNYFALFLRSCENNPTIDWIVFTDIMEVFEYPKNVLRVQMTFQELKKWFQSKFDFPIVLDSPYKLCDYKVMTGYLFNEYLKDYDYWGYSDADMLFGDIRKFLPDNKLEQYDKIGHLGHFTLYRNTEEINTLFMKRIYGHERYKEVLTSSAHFAFDEWFGININDIFINQKKRVWFFNDFFDVEAYEENFHRVMLELDCVDISKRRWSVEKRASFASWEDGHVYQWLENGDGWAKKEWMYVHFQKRKMEVCLPYNKATRFLCVPNQFIPYSDIIPCKYRIRSFKMGLINKRHWKKWARGTVYWIKEKTGPVRQWIFGKKRREEI